MNEIIIQVHADRKLSKKVVDIGNMQESGVTKLIFELDEDIVALGGNVYLITSYDGESHPHVLKDNSLEVDRSFTQRKKTETNIVVSTSEDTENPLDGVVWISNTLILTVDKNNINIDSINEEELPPSLKIVYDDLLNLQKDLQEKKDNDYWRGQQGPKGDAGSVKFVVVKELPTENIEENVMYLVQVESEEEDNKFLEYIYVDGAWECVGSASVEVDLTDYVKNTDYATKNKAGVVKAGTGTIVAPDGTIQLDYAPKNEIDQKGTYQKAIVPQFLDYAVMKALTDSKNHEWTEEEKAKALELLGAMSNKKPNGRNYGDGTVIGFNTNGKLTYQNVFGRYINPYSIPIRDSNGVLYANAPTEDNGLTTKKYVDDLVSQHDIITSASGEVVTTTDSAKVKPKNITLFGKGKQRQYEGNQILNPSMYQFFTGQVFEGIETTINEDGSVTLTGTPTRDSGNLFALFTGNYIDVLEDGETYITSESIEIIENGTTNWVDKVTVNKSTMTSVRPYMQRNVANYVNGETIYPMFNKGNTVRPFEPFVGNEPSPNMKYPQKVEFLGESGSIGGDVLRKNFLPNNATSKTENGVAFTVNADKSITIKGTPTAETYLYLVTTTDMRTLQKGKYVFSGGKDNAFLTMYKRNWTQFAMSKDNTDVDIELLEDTEYFCYLTVRKDVYYDTTIYPMIRPYGTDNTYESYSDGEQPFTFQTPNGLRGIPLGKTIPDAIKNSTIHMNGVYWDSVEQQYYIADTKNENGKDVQRIKELTTSDLLNIGGFINKVYDGCTEIAFATNSAYIGDCGLSDCFFYKSGGAEPRFAVWNTNIYIVLKGELTLEECITLFEESNPTFYVILAEPIITDTTDQYDVVMNYPNTTIVNDAGAYMEVEYVADTKKHIEQNYVAKSELEDIKSQMAEIQQVITNL